MAKLDGKKMTGDQKLEMMGNPKKYTLITPTTKGKEPSGDTYKGAQGKVKIPITHPGSLEPYHLDLKTTERKEILKDKAKEFGKGKLVKKLVAIEIFNRNHAPKTSEKVAKDVKFVQSLKD